MDDEPLALDLMRSMLERIPAIEIVAECKNGQEAIHAIGTHEPDLVYLDIQMPVVSGLDVAKSLQSDTMPSIVFATAYDEFALQAFDVHAVDYLLKPIDGDRLELSVARAAERLSAKIGDADRKARILGAIEQISDKEGASVGRTDEQARKLTIRDGGTVHIIDQEKIDWIDAAGDYMCLHVAGNTHIARITMKKLIGLLDDDIFSRIHRSTIVNLRRVTKVTPLPKGECLLHLDPGAELKVSRNYCNQVRDFLK